MLLTVLILCAVGVVVLLGREAFFDLWEAWSKPSHLLSEEQSHPRSWKPKPKPAPR